eukprot:6206763-Pleurochrysis_carterae.AAC.9
MATLMLAKLSQSTIPVSHMTCSTATMRITHRLRSLTSKAHPPNFLLLLCSWRTAMPPVYCVSESLQVCTLLELRLGLDSVDLPDTV